MRQTSIDSFKSIQDTLGDRQKLVYASLCVSPKTNLELSKALDLPINSICPRVNELVHFTDKHGHPSPLVKYGGIKMCETTGRRQIVWEAINCESNGQMVFA